MTPRQRGSISASRNALAINVILKAAMALPPQIARASCTSSSIASAVTVGDLSAQPGHCFDAFFRSELTEGRAHAGRYSYPRSPMQKDQPGWGIPSTRAIAGAKLQSDLLVAIGNP